MIDVKEGMIGFSGGNTFMQRAIRFFIGSRFSHSFTILNGPYGLSALETTTTIVAVTPFDRKAIEDNWVEIWEIIYPLSKSLHLADSYYRNVGSWYGYLSYFWFMYRWVARKFKHEPTTMWKWCNSGVTCTELTCKYIDALFPGLLKNDLNTYSPEELRNVMLNNIDKFTCVGWYKEL